MRLLLLLGACVVPLPASAQTVWTGTTSTDWFAAGNWNPAAVPGSGTSVQINTATPNPTVVGASGAQANQLTLGAGVGQTGDLTIDGAGSSLTLTNGAGFFLVGDFGNGDVTVSDGATLTTFTTAIGNQAGSTGSVTVTGANSQWNLTPVFAFHVGSSGTGTLDILAGGRVTSTSFGMDLGADNGASGTVTVSGTDSQLTVPSLTNIGSAAGGIGIMQADTGGLLSLSTVNVGSFGQGTLELATGADLTASQLTIGANATGEATFNGAGSTATITNGLRVGQDNGGDGTMNVEAGAVVTSSSGAIGTNTGATGEVTITGTDSRWTVTNALTIGQAANSGTGTLNVLDGGEVGAASFTGHNSATINIDGAGSEFGVTNGFTLGGTGATNSLDVTGGAAFSASAVDLSTVLGSGVAVTVSGAGTTFDATAITIGGAGTSSFAVSDQAEVEVTTGTSPDLTVDGANASLTISSGASVMQGDFGANTGTFNLGEDAEGTLTIESGGQLTTRFSVIGSNAGSDGSATVTGAGSTWTNRGVQVAFSGSGSLEIVDGGTVASDRSSRIAFTDGSEGSVLVSGTGSQWILSEPPPLSGIANITVGLGGTGEMRVEDGGYVQAQGIGVGAAWLETIFDENFAIIGQELHPGNGLLTITGPTTAVDVNTSTFQTFDAGGDGGTGVIEVLDGAVVTVVGQGHFGQSAVYAGLDPPQQLLGHGTLTVDGDGSRVTYTQTLDIGEQATGVLNVTDGGFISNSDGYLGSFTNAVGSAGHGTATVSGEGSIWENNGVLRVGDQGTGILDVLDGGMVTNTNGIMAAAIDSSGTATVSGAGASWANAGTLAIGSLGTATLNIAAGGAVSATGAASINALSTLNLGTGGGAGLFEAPSLANAGLLRFNYTGDFTFDVPTSGAGNVVKAGSGTTTIEGVHAYTGTTTIDDGTLRVNGTVASSAFSVADGAVLGGIGTLGATTIADGGTLAPGNSIGTMNVATALLEAGSIFEVEIDPTDADLLNVAGLATIESGAVVAVLAAPGAYTDGFQYLILDAGTRSGEFSGVVDTSAFLDYTLDHDRDANQVWLTVNNVASFPDVAETPNQMATAEALQALGGGNPLFDAVLALGEDEARAAFDLASGEIHASAKGVLLDDSRFVREAVIEHLREASDAGGAPAQPATSALGYAGAPDIGREGAAFADGPALHRTMGLWARGYGSWGRFDGDGNAAGIERDVGGLIGGLDAMPAADWLFGAAAGYQASSMDVTDRASSAGIEGYTIAGYGSFAPGTAAFRFGGSYGWHKIDTRRSVVFPGVEDMPRAEYDAEVAQVFGEASREYAFRGGRIAPFAGIAYVNVRTDGFTEEGGDAALTVASSRQEATYSTVGSRFEAVLPWGGGRAAFRGMLAWKHAFGDVTPESLHAFAGGTPFSIGGVPIARDTLRIDAGIDYAISDGASFDLVYSGEVASGVSDHGLTATLTVRY